MKPWDIIFQEDYFPGETRLFIERDVNVCLFYVMTFVERRINVVATSL